ncbi:hypothetical protein MMC06_001350 [Schaereria dolodes]|nr:hypothetical protein [Schaereria dolodes]
MDGLTLSPATTFLEQSTMFDLDPITSKMSSKSEGGACQDEVLFPTKYLPKASHMALTIPYKGQAVLRKASTDSASIAIDVGYGAMNVQQPSISVGPSNVLDEINIYHSSLEPIDSVDSENIQNSLPLLRMDFENFGREDDWRHIPLPDSAKASVGSQTGADLFLRTHAGPESYHADLALFPCTASGLLSPTLSSATGLSGCMTSTHLSQPETPTISEFDIDGRIGGIDRIEPSVSGGYELEEPLKDTMCAKHGGFDGYNLPEAEHGSALTLKNLETTGSRGSSHESHFAGKDGNDLVRSWNDGSEHNRGAMAELFKDLAYLGEMIV